MLQEKWYIEDVMVTGKGSPRWQYAFKGMVFFAGDFHLRIFSHLDGIPRPQNGGFNHKPWRLSLLVVRKMLQKLNFNQQFFFFDLASRLFAWKKKSCEVLIFDVNLFKKHNVCIYIYICNYLYIYIYISVCVCFPHTLSLSLSLSTRHCCNGYADGRWASTNQSNDGLMSFHRGDRLVTGGNTTWRSEKRTGLQTPFPSVIVFPTDWSYKRLFFRKKKGQHIGHWASLHGFPWTTLKTKSFHLERCHPQNQSGPSNQSIFAS